MESIAKSRLLVLLLVTVLTATVVITGCDLGSSSSSKSARRATVEAVVAVASTTGTAASSFQPSDAGCGDAPEVASDDDSRVSFTPSSMRINMLGMYLAEEGAYDATAGGVVGVTGTREFDIFKDVPATEIQLVGQTVFTPLLSGSTFVGADLFGDYENIKVLYGENMVDGGIGESNVYISGSVCDDGTLIPFTDLKIPMGSTGIGLNMPNKVTVSDAAPAVVRVLFDVQNYPYFIRHEGDANYPLVKIPGTDDIYVVADNPPFLPYAAAGEPVVEHYRVTLSGAGAAAFGTSWHLRVLAFKDEAGALVAVQWYPVYEAGFAATGTEGAFDPAMLYMAELTSTAANTYRIKNNDTMVVGGRSLEFPEFTLGAHSGTLKYGGTEYSYAAEKL